MTDFFRNLSISNKLAVVFLLMLSMMCVGGIVGLYNARQLAKATEHLYLDSFKRVEVLSSVENEFLSARQDMFLNTITTDHSSRSFLEVLIKERKVKINRLIYEYKSLGFADGREGNFNKFREMLSAYWHVHDRVGVYSKEGKRDAALAIMRMEGNRIFTDTIEALKMLIKQEREAAYASYQKSGFFARSIIAVTIIFTVIAVVTAVALWLALIRSIVRPILAIEESARLVGLGDLRQRVPVMTEDEIGRLAGEFNQMAESLENYYATLEKKVDERTDELSLANIELFAKKQELEKANIELRDANKMKSQFLANVSHELRTPLNSIIGFSELLGERAFGELNERQTQYVEYVHSSGEHLLKLINNILDLSKIETGRIALNLKEFPIAEVISEALGILKPAAHKKNITIETKTVPASPKLRADKEKFKQILLNLLSNAIKFNNDGGHIRIGWEMVEESTGMHMQRYLVFSVSDTGIGIKEEDKKKLFKEFEQIDSSITREYGGTGLGLVLTKRLVELHKGSIWFESDFGAGSVFYVKLPQGTDEIDIPVFSTPPSVEPFVDKGPLILLASESADINRLIEIYLADGFYDVSAVADGVALLRKAQERRPSVIIMGVTIPGKDGWEVLKELKANAETRSIPVIMLSSTDNRDLAISLGAADYLEKPVNKLKLMEALKRLHLLPPE
jgi:signal transduction histidine kinase/CheY-like chemotaxis protein